MITKEKTMSEDVVWCNLVRNHNKNEAKQPDWVAPPNENAPEGKKWTKGVKMADGSWWNQCAWDEQDGEGNVVGITVKISPPTSNTDKPATSNKGFQKKPNYDNKQSYKF
jgi:hypothetical protein